MQAQDSGPTTKCPSWPFSSLGDLLTPLIQPSPRDWALSPGITASSSFSLTSAQAPRWARRWACRRLLKSLLRRGRPPAALCSSDSWGQGWATWPAPAGSASLSSGSPLASGREEPQHCQAAQPLESEETASWEFPPPLLNLLDY